MFRTICTDRAQPSRDLRQNEFIHSTQPIGPNGSGGRAVATAFTDISLDDVVDKVFNDGKDFAERNKKK
jgi:hypothetical protein